MVLELISKIESLHIIYVFGYKVMINKTVLYIVYMGVVNNTSTFQQLIYLDLLMNLT